ncbi:MAG: EVE domain-containing protein [Bacteroidetes bacterium]|nr:EVE domain-containing protein [Bacteroidota bacterium]MDA1121831.1 EVE domain-containing protein [Bacteroidota bacterium]
MNYWLVKTEPGTYSWDDFVKLGRDMWNGVRNFQARNNLKAMKDGDEVLFYHSVTGKEVVGIAKVIKEHYPDPTADEPIWKVVDLVPIRKLNKPVGLAEIKADPRFEGFILVRNSRLSVMPVGKEHYDLILSLAE